jgi:diaminopimelate decarboxylase
MNPFHYQDNDLYCEQTPLRAIAKAYGTPTYVYSRQGITAAFEAYQKALAGRKHLVCYAVKANSNLAILQLLAQLGSGFDIVSGGELARVLAAGGRADTIVFSGVGKSPEEMRAALDAGIRCFNVESAPELERLNSVAAECGKVAPISIRVNPDVDAKTHPYISTGLKENKFGVDIAQAASLYQHALGLKNVKPVGVDCHIGSQLLDTAPFLAALDRLIALLDELASQGIHLQHLDLGGGLGVAYTNEAVTPIGDYIASLLERLGDRDIELMFEPGRSIVGMNGVLLTEVMYLKPTAHRNFALVDAAMNDLLRPALYGAWQDIIPLTPRAGEAVTWDIVGPVCETGDFLGKDRALCLAEHDLLAVTGAGAYGFTMASNYNSRPRPPEILVDGTDVYCIRQRETLESLWALETRLPEATP